MTTLISLLVASSVPCPAARMRSPPSSWSSRVSISSRHARTLSSPGLGSPGIQTLLRYDRLHHPSYHIVKGHAISSTRRSSLPSFTNLKNTLLNSRARSRVPRKSRMFSPLLTSSPPPSLRTTMLPLAKSSDLPATARSRLIFSTPSSSLGTSWSLDAPSPVNPGSSN